MTNKRLAKWRIPITSLVLGGAFLAAQWLNGDLRSGLESFAIIVFTGAVFLFGGRSETIRGLRGDGRDERFKNIDVVATAFAGTMVIGAILVAFIVEIARGHDGMPYAWLGGIAGLAYIAAIVWLRLRG